MLGQTPRRLTAVAPHVWSDPIGIVRREKPRDPFGDRQREVEQRRGERDPEFDPPAQGLVVRSVGHTPILGARATATAAAGRRRARSTM